MQFGLSKILDGDVILTYARSSVVELLLQSAHEQTVNFRVIIVDSRPMLEGRQLLERLAAAGVRCTYVMLNAISYIMRVSQPSADKIHENRKRSAADRYLLNTQEVTKVFVGAAALMSNGAALARAGTVRIMYTLG